MSLVESAFPVAREIEILLERLRPRANSLIVTVFGDTIMPRGGTIWLSHLVAMMGVLGLSERLVRTGVYRLSQEGWLSSHSVGRRAQYSLTPTGLSQFAAAGSRIYAHHPPPASDNWTLVQGLPEIGQAERQTLRRCLKWHGFGQFSTTLMARPGTVHGAFVDELASEGLQGKVLIFSASKADVTASQNLKLAAAQAWPLDDLNAEYARYLETFAGFKDLRRRSFTPHEAFALRALLIHEYRRILLKDPHLPIDLLPSPWHGSEAMRASAVIYKKIAPSSDVFVSNQMAEDASDVPALDDDYWTRFGGLE